MIPQQVSNHILLFLLGILFFVLPIGHTIALRNTAFVLLALLTLYNLSLSKSRILTRVWREKEIRAIFFILFVLTGWIITISFVNTENAHTAISDIKSGWLTPLLYFFIAFVFALYPFTQSKSFQYDVYLVIFMVMFVHVLYIDLQALKYYLDNQELLTRFGGLTEGPDKSNYITNTLLVFLVSDVVCRFRFGNKLLRVNNFVLALFILLVVVSSIIEGMRNGAVIIIFLGVAGAMLAFIGNDSFSKKYKLLFGVTLTAILILPTLYSITHDKRWADLVKTIPVAMDTINNKYWLNDERYPLPKSKDGTDVEISIYIRVSLLTEGIKLTFENPWGFGYAKNAFGRAIKEKYGDDSKGVGHSHSGILDLTIGAGYPGLVTWLFFGLYLCYLSYVHFFKHKNVFALILFLNILVFYSRSLVDSVMRDHMFITFMFLSGLVIAILYRDKLLPENAGQNE